MKKYGGVDTLKSIDEIQEAVIVGAPIIQNKMPKSRFGIVFGWIVYYAVTFVIAMLFVMITGIFEQPFYGNLPFLVQIWLIPSIPFILTLLLLLRPKRNMKKDAGD
jgi:hypothetical protein